MHLMENSKYLCFFGVGVLLQNCFEQFVQVFGRKPDFLCDNAPSKHGCVFCGVRCISPEELQIIAADTTVVITVKNYGSICQQLREAGVSDILISCYSRGYDIVHALKRPEEQFMIQGGTGISVREKWTLVTGASRGLGRLIALKMADLGSNIIAHARTPAHAEKTVLECRERGVKAIPVIADLSCMDSLNSMLDGLTQTPDIVFNNAAISPACGDFLSMPSENFADTYAVNVMAPVRICQRLIPEMKRRGAGRIICISSSIEKRPAEMAYACSKAALNKFVYDITPSLRGTGVMVSLADPGWVSTDMGGAAAPCRPESVIPGLLLGALIDGDTGACWFSAQDYAGLTIDEAIAKATFIMDVKKMETGI